MKNFNFVSHSETETQKLAEKIGRVLRKNDCLALSGNFGSGKTTFVKGLVRGLKVGKKHFVCSPSFVILKIYHGRLPVYHFDLYRLNDVSDFFNIGFDDFVSGGGISVIEWAEKIRSFLPEGVLKISFKVSGPQKRNLRLTSSSARMRKALEKAVF